MVAGAPSSHVSAAFCCIVYAIACPAILFPTVARVVPKRDVAGTPRRALTS
jgi:hypothetical protein